MPDFSCGCAAAACSGVSVALSVWALSVWTVSAGRAMTPSAVSRTFQVALSTLPVVLSLLAFCRALTADLVRAP